MENEFIIDPARCIGCEACVAACAECDTHRGESMIHLEFVNRAETVQTTPQVCMHCEEPTCALVCPADAIKQTPDGVVQSSLKPRCIGCSNCVLACPFGVPKYFGEINQMMKCDMCYDHTSVVWPCPSVDHPGTPRLFEDKKYFTPDGKAHFNAVEFRPPAEVPDEKYPIILTTGRVVSQYLSGTQTRRIGGLVDQYP